MRILRTVLAIGLLGIVLAGCTPAPAPSPEPTETVSTPTPTGPDAIGLVGLWRVSGAESESPDTWLRLDAGEANLWRDCGVIDFSWAGQNGYFIAGLSGWSGCSATTPPVAPWLEQAVGYEQVGDGWSLIDDDGTIVASLAVDGAPQPHPNVAEFYTQAPVVTSATVDYFRSTPLPPFAGARRHPGTLDSRGRLGQHRRLRRVRPRRVDSL